MGELFGSAYCWCEDIFGLDLANYLWGEASPLQTTNMFVGIGWSMIVISFLVAVGYYKVLDHPRWNTITRWGVFLVVNAVANFVLAWQWVLGDYYEGLMQEKDVATGKMIDLSIDGGNLLAFGCVNAMYAVVVFILLSCAIKQLSRNCSHTPF